ncbi:MAG: hypothetical protein JXA97_09580 [Anaerolineales bacterium]|nr:hypothetical protein [Anaerolineales bacterium]
MTLESRHLCDEDIQIFLDGAGTREWMRAAGEHLETCADCLARAEAWQKIFLALAELPEERSAISLRATVLADIRQTESKFPRFRFALGVESVLIVSLGWFLWANRLVACDLIASYAAELTTWTGRMLPRLLAFPGFRIHLPFLAQISMPTFDFQPSSLSMLIEVGVASVFILILANTQLLRMPNSYDDHPAGSESAAGEGGK